MNPTQPQTQSAPTRTATARPPEVTDFERLLGKEGKDVRYVPFGGVEPIRLTVKLVQDYIAVPTKSGRTCSERDAMRFIMLCHAQHLNPFAGDAYLTGYDGKDGPQFSLITAHLAILKRAESCEAYEGMESGIVLHNPETGETVDREGDFCLADELPHFVGAWARVHRRGRRPTYRRLSLSAVKPNYNTPFWEGVKACGQCVKCAEADALRSCFPTTLGALYVDGEFTGAIDRLLPEATNGRRKAHEESPLVDVKPPTDARSAGQVLSGMERGLAHAAEVRQGQDEERKLAEMGIAPAQPTNPEPKPTEPSTNGSRKELQDIVTGGGFTFNDLQKWAMDTGGIPGADSLGSFDEIPEAAAKRLVKSKVGLLRGLAEMKAGAA